MKEHKMTEAERCEIKSELKKEMKRESDYDGSIHLCRSCSNCLRRDYFPLHSEGYEFYMCLLNLGEGVDLTGTMDKVVGCSKYVNEHTGKKLSD